MSGDFTKPGEPMKLPPELVAAIGAAAAVAAENAATIAAERAAKEVVLEFLVQLGIDAEKASSLIERQKDMAFLNKLRRSAESKPAQVGMAAIGALFSVIGALIVLGIQYVIAKLH